jgi:hypothetical protein
MWSKKHKNASRTSPSVKAPSLPSSQKTEKTKAEKSPIKTLTVSSSHILERQLANKSEPSLICLTASHKFTKNMFSTLDYMLTDFDGDETAEKLEFPLMCRSPKAKRLRRSFYSNGTNSDEGDAENSETTAAAPATEASSTTDIDDSTVMQLRNRKCVNPFVVKLQSPAPKKVVSLSSGIFQGKVSTIQSPGLRNGFNTSKIVNDRNKKTPPRQTTLIQFQRKHAVVIVEKLSSSASNEVCTSR